MAYVSQEKKKALAPGIKKVLAKYKMKGSIRVKNHSTLVVNIKQGALDVRKDSGCPSPHYQVNPFWVDDHYTGQTQSFLNELVDAMKGEGYRDDTDAMIDYFSCDHYYSINLGTWNTEYKMV
jgi:hypothetical protein